MVKEKALVDSRANKNMIDIRTAHKLGIWPRLLPREIQIHNIDRTDNREGTIKYWTPIAIFQGNQGYMFTFYIVDLAKDWIIFRYPWFKDFNPNIDWLWKHIQGPPFFAADTSIDLDELRNHTK